LGFLITATLFCPWPYHPNLTFLFLEPGNPAHSAQQRYFVHGLIIQIWHFLFLEPGNPAHSAQQRYFVHGLTIQI